MVKTRSNAEWLSALKSSGAEQAAAIADLRAYLLRGARYALQRQAGRLGPRAASVDHLAEDCTQDALMAVLHHLDDFRGESRFTTWVYSFVVNLALIAARRERWKRVPLDSLLDTPTRVEAWGWDQPAAVDPQRRALQRETLAAIREGIDDLLTDRQRQVLKAIVFDGVPLDEVTRHWQSNRNAVYKLLHDARRKLKAHLEKRGLSAPATIALFSQEG